MKENDGAGLVLDAGGAAVRGDRWVPVLHDGVSENIRTYNNTRNVESEKWAKASWHFDQRGCWERIRQGSTYTPTGTRCVWVLPFFSRKEQLETQLSCYKCMYGEGEWSASSETCSTRRMFFICVEKAVAYCHAAWFRASHTFQSLDANHEKQWGETT